MKTTILRIFAGLVDFYSLSYALGLVLMFFTVLNGPVAPSMTVGTIGIALIVVVFYHLFSRRFSYLSPGEIMVGIVDQTRKEVIASPFTITRIPIYLVSLLILAFVGNLLDGLSEGRDYSPASLLFFGLIGGCIYYGMRNYFIRPQMPAIWVVAMGLLLASMLFQIAIPLTETKILMRNVYAGLAVLWVVSGLAYLKKKKEQTNTAQD
jgi:hypothetical protein